jgi:hypothetical protein
MAEQAEVLTQRPRGLLGLFKEAWRRQRRRRLRVALILITALIAATVLFQTKRPPSGRSTYTNGGIGARGQSPEFRKDAAALLTRVILPPGSQRVDRKPYGDGGQLAQPASRFTHQFVDVHAWWTTPEPIRKVETFLRYHLTTGATGVGRGYARGGTGPVAFYTESFRPLQSDGEAHPHDLAINMVPLAKGGTGIRVDSEVAIARLSPRN